VVTDEPSDDEEVLRAPDGRTDVTFAELFFDLVYVVGVTQVSARLAGDLTYRGALESLLFLLPLWWAWVSTAWFTNWFDPDRRPVRMVLVLIMLASLVMTAAVPEALGDRGLWFAGAYVSIQVGRSAYAVVALRRRRDRVERDGAEYDEADRARLRDQERTLVWALVSAVPWLVGGVVLGPARVVLWALALALDYGAPAVGFRVPGLGRSVTTDWDIEGQHLAERCQLFLIVAFGESILATGATFADDEPTASTVAGLAVAFAGNVALWWVYFDQHAERAADTIARHHDPGRLGRSAYTYLHVPMVAGIIVTAVGDELALSNPTGTTALATAATVLGGPALFVAGHAVFKAVLFRMVSVPRLVTVAALGLLAPTATVVSPLTLSLFATLVVAALAAWDVWRPPTLQAPDVPDAGPGEDPGAGPGEDAGDDADALGTVSPAPGREATATTSEGARSSHEEPVPDR
jgi:low temperature requirement protein LtrA